jgi:cytochrome c2
MAWLDSASVLLTVGDFGFDGTSSTQQFAQDPQAAYGKTIRIRPEEKTAEIFTSGHRNPEGLYVQREDGVIWLTEHGPQGGDELNRLEVGANYGWPYTTYGTQYGTFTWPVERRVDPVAASVPPTFAWLPSIGVSSLIRVENSLFSSWQGDLLVGSLVGKTLYRLKVIDQRIVFAEPISIGERIRDVAEGTSGRIVLWTDEGTIISLGLAAEKNGETLFATLCSGCHQLGDGSNHRIGPDLGGIPGRAVASAEGYVYSPAMRAKGGRWTPDRLRAFLLHPQSEVPSTTMEFPGLPDSSGVSALIEYLRKH